MFEPKMLFLEEDGSGTGDQADDKTTPKPKLTDLIKEHNLQDDLNAMMAENRRKLTQQNSELVKQLEEIKRNAALTNEQRDELQGRITQLEEQYMTKEELAKREKDKQAKEYESKLQQTVEQSEQWKGLYTSSTIDRALQDAAVVGEAIRPSVIVDLLRSKTQLTEVMENGQPTGRYTPIVKFNDIGENGENVILDLSPEEAIKRMKELPDDYGFLFKGTATSGIGSARRADGSAPAPRLQELLKDPEKYAKWRKENPNLPVDQLR